MADSVAANLKEMVRVQIKTADKGIMINDMHKKIEVIIESKPSGVNLEHFLNGTRKNLSIPGTSQGITSLHRPMPNIQTIMLGHLLATT